MIRNEFSHTSLNQKPKLLFMQSQTNIKQQPSHTTQHQQNFRGQSGLYQGIKRIKSVYFKVKVQKIAKVFINKLKQNALIPSKLPITKLDKVKKFQKVKIIQTIYHIIIVLHFFAILCLLLLTSWTCTLIKFIQSLATSPVIVSLKVACLFIFLCQFIGNFVSYNLKQEKDFKLSCQFIKQILLRFNMVNSLIKIIFCSLFIALPKNMGFSAIFFIQLFLTILFQIPQLSYLQAAYIHTQKKQLIVKISRILGLNLFMVHTVATILIGMTHLNQSNNWFIKYQIVKQDWNNQYINAFYWSTIIVTTIGFGDLSPASQNQQIIVSFLAIFACILLAYNISTFSDVLRKLRANYEQSQQKMIMFTRMVRRDYKNNVLINPIVKKKIITYIQHLSHQKMQLQFTEKSQLLAALPKKLRKEYYKNTNKLLYSSIVFLNLLKNQTLQILCEKFKIYFIEAQEVLYPSDLQINILQQGQIGFTYFKRGSKMNGKVFDSIKVRQRQSVRLVNSDFLSLSEQSNFGMKAKYFSILWSISTQNFLNVLRNNAVDFQFYFSMLHKYFYDSNQWGTIECPRCVSYGQPIRHTTFKCPLVSYIPIRTYSINKLFLTPEINQERHKILRKKLRIGRVSVLKYWYNYLKKNYQLERKRGQQNHKLNLSRLKKSRKKVTIPKQIPLSKRISQRSYNQYYLDKQKEEIIQQQRHLNFQVNIPFNFEFYMPQFNPDRLIFTPIHQSMKKSRIKDNIPLMRQLKELIHTKDKKFSFQTQDYRN